MGLGDGEVALAAGIGSGDALVGQFVVETKADKKNPDYRFLVRKIFFSS